MSGMIDQLIEAMIMITEVEIDCDNKGIDSMLSYCEDYINIAIKAIERWKNEP